MTGYNFYDDGLTPAERGERGLERTRRRRHELGYNCPCCGVDMETTLASVDDDLVPDLELATLRAIAKDGAYVQAALLSEITRVMATTEGGRNCQLNESAFALGTLVGACLLEYQVAERALTQAGLSTGLGQREVASTVRSGLSKGVEHPRQVPG